MQWFLKLKQWWDSDHFKVLSDQMKYAKSCNVGGNSDLVDFTAAEEDIIADCPDFMEVEGRAGREDTVNTFQDSREEHSDSASLHALNTKERLDVLETTLRQQGSILIEQGNIQKEMLRILQGLELEKEPCRKEPLPQRITSSNVASFDTHAEPTVSTGALCLSIATEEDVTMDEVENDFRNSGPALVLPGYVLNQQQQRMDGMEHVSAL